MVTLWSGIAALVVVALFFIWLPIVRGRPKELPAVDRNKQNVAIFKARLAELEKELADNNLDQASFDDLKQELEKSLLSEVEGQASPEFKASKPSLLLPVLLTVLLPAVALGFYWQRGYSQPLAVALQRAQSMPELAGEGPQKRIIELKTRLEKKPQDPEGWYMLAQAFLDLQRYKEAYDSLRVVTKLIGDYPPVLAQQAQTLYFIKDSRVTPEVQGLVDRALAVDPQDPGTLGFLGLAAFEKTDYQQAINYWQQALNSGKPGVDKEGLKVAIAHAKAQLQKTGGVVAKTDSAGSTNKADKAGVAASIPLHVSLSPELASKAGADTVVFVIAQAVNGPKMPLAATRIKVADLPADIVLDDSLSMAPMAKLSNVDQVMVKAIVSFSGTAGARSGDFQGIIGPLAVREKRSKQVDLKIDQVVQ